MKYKFLDKLGLIFLSVNVKTTDGQPLFISDLASNGTVEVIIDGEKMPLPDGSWDLENGKTIMVKDGMIEDVVDTIPTEEVPADQTETVVEEGAVEDETPTEDVVETPSDETPTEDMTPTDVPAEEVVSAAEEVIDEVVTAVVEDENVTIDEVTTLKDKVAELEAKLAELTQALSDKEAALNMASEKLEQTIGTKKETVLTSNVSDADKNKYWYKKLHGIK